MYRFILLALMLFLIPSVIQAEGTISVPWEEFRNLYQESIEKKVMEKIPEQNKAQVYTIEQNNYNLKINKHNAVGELSISGKVISGIPEPIPLFKQDMVINQIKQVTGGSLICIKDDLRQIAFLPSSIGDFKINITFLAQTREDERSHFLKFHIPRAIKNILHLETDPDIELLEKPGIAINKGVYHFSSRSELVIRIKEKKQVLKKPDIKVDILTRIRLSEQRLVLMNTFITDQSLPYSFTLKLPDGFEFLSTSLKNTFVKKNDDNSYKLDLGINTKIPFQVGFISENIQDSNDYSFSLPFVESNKGSQGNFIIEQPDDYQVSLINKSLVSQIPVSRLGKEIRAAAKNERFFMRIPVEKKINLKIKRFQQIFTPPVVLDSMSFFTSFEENGSILSVLVMDIPEQAGSRIAIKAVANADIWSLKVNNKSKKIFGENGDSWVIPLLPGNKSHVELSFIRKGEKLGLSGRLETILPETGLPSRQVLTGIALPERVQLLSLEGPVSPVRKMKIKTPAEFIGRPYFFSRSFYKGNGMKMAVAYKEPVKKR